MNATFDQPRTLVSDIGTFHDITYFMTTDKCTTEALNSRFLGRYGSIKAMNHFLPIMADLENEVNVSSLKLFKEAVSIIQKVSLLPILEKVTKFQTKQEKIVSSNNLNKQPLDPRSMHEEGEVLSKWWNTYLSILCEAYQVHSKPSDPWVVQNNENKKETPIYWFDETESESLHLTLKTLNEGNHGWWEMVLIRTICSKEEFFKNMAQNEGMKSSCLFEFESLFESLKNYELKLLKRERDVLEIEEKKSKVDNTVKLRKNVLQSLIDIIDSKNDVLLSKNSLISGFFHKNKISSLRHSVLICDDGGHYLLLNTIIEEERRLLLEGGFIKEEYIKRISKDDSEDPQKKKLVIGQGSFGKIRLCLSITSNHTSEVMRPGLLVCCKKTAYVNKKVRRQNVPLYSIRKNCWNDYLVVEIGHLVHSPDVYDMHIIEKHPGIEEVHCKAYTIQKYLPVLDGMKAFTAERRSEKGNIIQIQGPFYKEWVHQRAYFITIFKGIINLLNVGVSMTDLKPGNTLYNSEDFTGTLIDLSGIVCKKSKKHLEKTKVGEVSEFTEKFADTEFLRLFSDNKLEDEVDLCKFATYSMGKMLEETEFEEKVAGDIKKLVEQMITGYDKRITIEESFAIFQTIWPILPKLDINFAEFINKLKEENKGGKLKSFGLNENIEKVKHSFIDQTVSYNDLDRYVISNPDLYKLDFELEEFLKSNDRRTFVLLGSSGSGKSTILQIKYLEALDKWKEGDPIPIFINLSLDTDLKIRWENICSILGYSPNDTIFNFNVFKILEYPVVVYVDSFDEAPIKINYVSEFHECLGSNEKNKIVICCRSEFIQADLDFQRFFTRKHQELKESIKRFIVSLKKTEFKLSENFISKFYSSWKDSHNNKLKNDPKTILEKIEQTGSSEMLSTGYMVHLTLTVFPELLEELQNRHQEKKKAPRITKIKIYAKYIDNFLKKVDEKTKDFIAEKYKSEFHKNESRLDFWLRFARRAGILLAKTIHAKAPFSSKVEKNQASAFMSRYFYDSQFSCLNNLVLAAVIRGLDLIVDVKGKPPNEKISLGFSHDTIKNYFLIQAIKQDCSKIIHKNTISKLLGLRVFASDAILVQFLADDMKADPEFQDHLTKIIYKTREHNVATRMCIAASNAITILIAGGVNFSNQDLSRVKIRESSLRDGIFSGVNFSEAQLTGAVMENTILDGALFERSNLVDVKLGISTDMNLKSQVMSCRFNPNDENELLCGCYNGDIYLMDRKTGKAALAITKYNGSVNSVRFSPDVQKFITGSQDQTVKIWEKTTGNLLKTLTGHEHVIYAVDFSKDGQIIASGSFDKTVKLWETETGKLLSTFEGHKDFVYSLVFSPDNDIIATGSKDKTVIIWERSTGKFIKTIDEHSDTVFAVAFSPNGEHLLSSSGSSLKLWDRKDSFKLIQIFEGHAKKINGVMFSHDGLFIISCSDDLTVKLWEKTGNLVKTLEVHSKFVYCVAFSHDDQLIASGSQDYTVVISEKSASKLLKTFLGNSVPIRTVALSADNQFIASGGSDSNVKLWERSNGSLAMTFQGHSGCVTSVAFSPNEELIASASSDCSIRLWEKSTGNLSKILQGHSEGVSCVVFSPDGQFIASGAEDCTVNLWEKTTGKILRTMKGHSNPVNSVVFTSDGLLIASGSVDRTVKLWERTTGNLLNTLEGHAGTVNSVVFSVDGSEIASASYDETIILWDRALGHLIRAIKGHSGPVNSVAFSQDGYFLVSGSDDKTVKIWEKSTGSLIETLLGHSLWIRTVAFSLDGNFIVSGSGDKNIKVWGRSACDFHKKFQNIYTSISGDKTIKISEKSKEKSKMNEITKKIYSIALSPDGQLIATGSNDKTINLWEKSTANLLKSLQGHSGSVRSVTFSPDGQMIASASGDKTIKLWDKSKGKLLKTLEGHSRLVYCVAFSLDGELLISGSDDDMIKMWEKNTGKLMKTFEGHSGSVRSVVFSPNSQLVASASSDKTVRVWEVSSGNTVKTFKGHAKIVRCVTFSKDGQLLASESDDLSVKLWDQSTDEAVKTISSGEYIAGLRVYFDGKSNNLMRNLMAANFYQIVVISSQKSDLSCKNTMFINTSGLSDHYITVLNNKGGCVYMNPNYTSKGLTQKLIQSKVSLNSNSIDDEEDYEVKPTSLVITENFKQTNNSKNKGNGKKVGKQQEQEVLLLKDDKVKKTCISGNCRLI